MFNHIKCKNPEKDIIRISSETAEGSDILRVSACEQCLYSYLYLHLALACQRMLVVKLE
jgi:hypothetical protein